MINHTYSLEEMPVGYDGMVQLPVICEACYQAIHHERHARSAPRSYAALATSPYRFTVVDWMGLGITTCRACGTNDRASRYSVEVHRR